MQPAAIVVLIAVIVIALAVVAAVAKYLFSSKTPSSSGKTTKKLNLFSKFRSKFNKKEEEEEFFEYLPLLPAGSSKRVVAILSKKMAVRNKISGAKISDCYIESGEYVVDGLLLNVSDKMLVCLAPADNLSEQKWVYFFDRAPIRFKIENIPETSEEDSEEEPD